MAKDKKVISLSERRRGRPENKPSPSGADPERRHGAGSGAGDAQPVPGRMIWLHCPTCSTLEYTEVDMAGGRVHNACGTMVEEAEVELDLRAEYTVADINLERLTILEELVEGQRRRYEEYKRRLSQAAGQPLRAYPLDEERLKALPVAEMDALGLLVSHFFQDPARHFGEGRSEEDEERPEQPEGNH